MLPLTSPKMEGNIPECWNMQMLTLWHHNFCWKDRFFERVCTWLLQTAMLESNMWKWPEIYKRNVVKPKMLYVVDNATDAEPKTF